MYLKTIEVQGFKSFAHKMTFTFQNGITGIVGPNGSGKSNVADAVRWVLGEQSAKQLRGGNMQDVIFAGTELRKPQSFASVAITFDNSDRHLATDFKEVTVTRRLYRSGESEYLLNGSNVRLRDIHELFYDTGIGKEGYSIIGQGRIDQIMSAKAEDRRELFDEAVGIVKFKRRKNTALKKLQEERQNLLRVSDILRELEGRVEPLRKQSEKAKVYLEKKHELRVLDVNMYLLEAERVERLTKEADDKIAIASRDMEESRAAFEDTKKEYEEVEKTIDDLEEEIRAAHKETEEKSLKVSETRGKGELIHEQIRALHADNERFLTRAAYLKEALAARTKDIAEKEADGTEGEKLVLAIAEEKEAKDREIREVEHTLAVKNEEAEEARQGIISTLNSRAQAEGRIQRYDTLHEQIALRSSEIASKEKELSETKRQSEEELASARKKETEAAKLVSDLKKTIAEEEGAIEKIRISLALMNGELEDKNQRYLKESSRLESLKNITERYEGYGNAIQTVMARKKNVKGICGVVADLIKVDEKYETAIETALGGSIRNIVTDTQETAKEMISLLKSTRSGRATFLPLNALTLRGKADERVLGEEGVIDLASRLVTTEKRFSILPDYLLGRTFVVDTIDHAIQIGNKYKHSLYMVTLAGDSFSPGGSMTGGAFKSRDNLLSRRREIEELTASSAALYKDTEKLRQKIADARTKRDSLREKDAADTARLREASVELGTARITREQFEAELSRIEGESASYAREKSELRKQTETVSGERTNVSRELESSDQMAETLRQKVEALASEIAELEKKRDGKLSEAQEILLRQSGEAQKKAYLEETVKRLRWEKKSLQAEADELMEEMGSVSEELKGKTEEEEALRKELVCLQEDVKKGTEAEAEMRERKDRLREDHRSFFEKRDALSEKIAALDKELYRLEAQKEKYLESIESQTEYIWNEYELTPSEAKKEKAESDKSYTALKKDVGAVKAEIRALGEVNVNAIEEYKETSERYEFLKGQHEDLVKSEDSLLKIIDELDKGMRRQFQTEFEKINQEFDKVFKELFGGGCGSLVLEEGEDVLEAGISIISQPPGKKLQNMMQLSGGEKSLTAIALLFAIQNLKPSPFCLLDEIEAALDEANVTRFTRYLRKLTDQTQFIVITHRRGTMAAADRLYGITMQEKGVSALVSVNLVQDELDA